MTAIHMFSRKVLVCAFSIPDSNINSLDSVDRIPAMATWFMFLVFSWIALTKWTSQLLLFAWFGEPMIDDAALASCRDVVLLYMSAALTS
jgi:hypothetical protein